MRQLKKWITHFLTGMKNLLPGQSYFPSGRYKSFHGLDRPAVARMIEDYCEENTADFSERALMEFIFNPPEIEWMNEVGEKLYQVMKDIQSDKFGVDLKSPEGKIRAIEIANELRQQSRK